MYCVDTSKSERLPILMETVGAVSRARTPQEIYKRFRSAFDRMGVHDAYMALSTRGLKPGEYKITRFERRGEPDLERDPWAQWNALPTHTGGFLGELIRGAWPELIHNLDVRDDPAVGDALRPYGSLMAVPIFDRGEPLNWAIALAEDPVRFDLDDLEQMVFRANLIGGMTKGNLLTQQLSEAQKRINEEVERIATIQRALLPDPLPEIAGVSLGSSYRTSARAGGDYYDFFALDSDRRGRPDPNGRWGILVADASGHGPSAAVVMAMLHAILHGVADRDQSPATILEHANRQLCGKRIESSFVTAFYGVYNASTRMLEYARAGHNPPIIKNGASMLRLDHVGGFPLGVDQGLQLDTHAVELKPGQTLVLYTDGITEAMNDARQMFGVSGIERALVACSGQATCTIHSINDALIGYGDPDSPQDDQTIVVMRVDDV